MSKFKNGDYVVEKDNYESLYIVLSIGPNDDAEKGEISVESVIGEYGSFSASKNDFVLATVDDIKVIAANRKEELEAEIADELKTITDQGNKAIKHVNEAKDKTKGKSKRRG